MPAARAVWIISASTLLVVAACQSTIQSEPKLYQIGEESLRVSARAELGATSDEIILMVNDTDVASGVFARADAAGLTLQCEYGGVLIQARCTFRWRLGLHIGHRCSVYIEGDGPVILDF